MPIFMIGTQRSGSNLLRLILNQLPEIAAPHPPHILQRMMPLMKAYNGLQDDLEFKRLVDDVCRLVELNPVAWEGVTLDRTDVARRCRERSLVAVFGAVYDVLKDAKGAKDWCCKSLANIFYIKEIEQYYHDAKYIYLYRDGRDVAVSFRKAVVGEKHFYHIAREWGETQRLALEWRTKLPTKRFLSISYEQLTGEPEKSAQRLCEFVGAAFRPETLEFHKSDEAKRAAASSQLWGNLTNPIMAKNSQKFLKEASEDDIRVFESVAGDVLDTLGYARAVVQRGQERHYSATEVAEFDRENRILKDATRKQVDPADLERRNRQETMIKEIAARARA